MADSVKHYHPRPNPYEPGTLFREEKVLDGGLILELTCGVSAVECIGTPTYVLHLVHPNIDENGVSPGAAEMLVSRPWSAMLSEAAYRMVMGRINSKEDFYKIQEELAPMIDGLVKRFYERTNPI